uniref:Jupiter microtubule associated homolog 1a n=1 Tax=Sinocyclocheilus grahami TaxID=75366 RepID=A0A672RMP9_SINGR
MTSTNMYQGLDSSGKPSSRILRPPGGGSSNLFGGYEEDPAASRRQNKMSSSIFAPPEETRGGPRRSNPPGELSADTTGQTNKNLKTTAAHATEAAITIGAIVPFRVVSSQQ